MTDLWAALFGSVYGFVQCPCGAVVLNTEEARAAHICQRPPAPDQPDEDAKAP
jgi:hypothetical protein